MRRTIVSISLLALGLFVILALAESARAQGGSGTYHVIYQDQATNDLVQLYNPGGTWQSQDITALAGTVPTGGNGSHGLYFAPSVGHVFTALVDTISDPRSEHIYYTSETGDLESVYWQPGTGTWTSDDLTQNEGLPSPGYQEYVDYTIVSPLTSILDTVSDKGSRHIYYLCGLDICSGYWHPAGGGSWSWQDLSTMLPLSHAPTARENYPAITSFIDTSSVDKGARHIFYTSTYGDIIGLYWHPAGGGSWTWTDLSSVSGAGIVPNPNSDLTSFVDSAGDRYVFYVAGSYPPYHVHRLLWTPSVNWTDTDMSTITSPACYTNDSVLTSLNNNSSYTSQVFFMDVGDVLQTAHTSQWQCQALENPQLTGAGYTLTSFTASSSIEKVFNIGPGAGTSPEHILMHTGSGTSWSSVDLSNTVGSPPVPENGGFGSFIN